MVFGEVAKVAPEDPAVWAGLGSAVASSAGVLVVAPFVQWGTRCFQRSLALSANGPFAEVARDWLTDLRQRKEYKDLPAMTVGELDELLRYLDIEAALVVNGIDGVSPDDQMFLVMAIGELAVPRFVPVLAAAIAGRWGAGAARAGLKRVGPFLGAPEIREAMQALRRSPLGAECDPYLASAEGRPVPPPPPTIERGLVKARPEPAGVPAARPWWKFW